MFGPLIFRLRIANTDCNSTFRKILTAKLKRNLQRSRNMILCWTILTEIKAKLSQHRKSDFLGDPNRKTKVIFFQMSKVWLLKNIPFRMSKPGFWKSLPFKMSQIWLFWEIPGELSLLSISIFLSVRVRAAEVS